MKNLARGSLPSILAALAISSVLSAQADSLDYDYIELSTVDTKYFENGVDLSGYNLDVSWQLGNHFSLLLGFDNVNGDTESTDFFRDERLKTKHFGFGFRSEVAEDLDFVIEYSKDDYQVRIVEIEPGTVISYPVDEDGDTTKIGLRGQFTPSLQWDLYGVRMTLDDADVDDSGFQAAVRYAIVDDLSVGLSVARVGDFEQTALSFRYNY
ncbi:MAG: hypothetical protein HWE11_04825 [Gammaproteobacteria bacterium]|nr:hypothetical protein [Gammaproteobacteria bacterium]